MGSALTQRKWKHSLNGPRPKISSKYEVFLGMTSYYRRFVKGYRTIARPLTELLKRGGFKWDPDADNAFKQLNEALVSTHVLGLPDLSKAFTIEADLSQHGIGAVLMQNRHWVAYISKYLSPKNQALSVYDKELLALVYAVEKWHSYLSIKPFVIRMDQKSLRHLLEQKLSTPSQFGWLTKLMGMNYKIQYKKGSDNSVADALSRAPHGELLHLSVSSISTELWDMIKREWNEDPKLISLVQPMQQQPREHPRYRWADGTLTRKGKLVVGAILQTRRKILEWLHASPVGGHSGVRATGKRIKSLFYWKNMLRDIKEYILKCDPCLCCKNENVASSGLLQPMPIPQGVWFSIAMDFIEGLLRSNGKDIILVVVDRLSKYAHFVALAHPMTFATLA